jgi:hypothetical protein
MRLGQWVLLLRLLGTYRVLRSTLENVMADPGWSCAKCGQWLPDVGAWDISQGDGFLCRSCAKPDRQGADGDQQRGMLRLVEFRAAAAARADDQPLRPPMWRWFSLVWL